MAYLKYKGSIRKKLISIILLITFVTSFIGYVTFLSWYMNNQEDRVLNLSNTVGLIIGQDVAKLILLNNVDAASEITSKLKSFSNLKSMVLYKLDQSVIYQYNKLNKSFLVKELPKKEHRQNSIIGNTLTLYIDASYQNHNLGYVQLDFQIETIRDIIKKDIVELLIIFLFILTFSYVLAIYFAKKFTHPILSLVNFLEHIDPENSLKQRLQSVEDNEFEQLYDEVNSLLYKIESSYKALKIASVSFETQSGMIITDKNNIILRVNKAFTQISGYSFEEVIGKNPSILKSDLYDKQFYDNMYESLRKNNIWIGEIKNKHKNGSIVNEKLMIQSVLDQNNEIIYYVASFLDVTQQKNIETELIKKEQLLIQQSKMAQMGEMLENIAHQWRQPLSLISSSASGIRVQKEYNLLTDEILNASIQNIENATQQLSQTIDDFRNFYKDDKIAKKFNLKNSIDKSIVLVSKFINQNINIQINIDDFDIIGYENELIQVFINILNNAKDELIHKTHERSIQVTALQKNDNFIEISFLDNAGGIPADIIEYIFDNHFTTKSSTTGTGIGLYMSKLMISKMGGSLSVENKRFTLNNLKYQGADFVIKIPRNIK